MSNDPKKKDTPETADENAEPNEENALGEEELDKVSGGTATNVSPELRDALKKAGRVGRA